MSLYIKALANEDTLLPTGMFLCLPARATFVADTKFVSGTQKMFLIFFSETFCVCNKCFPVCAPKKHHEQQCVRNNLSSFASTLSGRINGSWPAFSWLMPRFCVGFHSNRGMAQAQETLLLWLDLTILDVRVIRIIFFYRSFSLLIFHV